jgi:hypothetical protein
MESAFIKVYTGVHHPGSSTQESEVTEKRQRSSIHTSLKSMNIDLVIWDFRKRFLSLD